MQGSTHGTDQARPWEFVGDSELQGATSRAVRVYGESIRTAARETGVSTIAIANIVSGITVYVDDITKERLVAWLMARGWSPKYAKARQ
jgi:hypothetical protein